MDVRQLSALVAIADHGTFSGAARALYTVQSNVSGHVAKLEKELGVRLIDRSQGGLTEEGARVVERARRILHEMDDIAADMASLDADVVRRGPDRRDRHHRPMADAGTARGRRPRPPAGPHDRPRGQHHDADPERPVSGQLHAAIVHLPIDDPELVIAPLFAEDLLVIVPDHHQFADRSSMALGDLDDIPLLLPPKGTALRRVLDRAASTAGITLRAQAEIDGVRLLASLAIDGYGAAIVPATAVPQRFEGAFRRIAVPELPQRVVAWVRRRRPAPSVAGPSGRHAARRGRRTRRGRSARRARRHRRVPARALRVGRAV